MLGPTLEDGETACSSQIPESALLLVLQAWDYQSIGIQDGECAVYRRGRLQNVLRVKMKNAFRLTRRGFTRIILGLPLDGTGDLNWPERKSNTKQHLANDLAAATKQESTVVDAGYHHSVVLNLIHKCVYASRARCAKRIMNLFVTVKGAGRFVND